MMTQTGQLVALATALCWTVTALFFEAAGRKIGSLVLNLLRLLAGLLFLGVYTLITRGSFLPLDAPASAWLWLGLSGFVGLALGDFFLFRAFILIGARRTMLVYASVPVLTTLLGMAVLGEIPGMTAVLGMLLTIGGICLVVLFRPDGEEGRELPVSGVILAFFGSLGQALGIIFTKQGMPAGYDPFAANEIRSLGGILGMILIFTLLGRWRSIGGALRHPRALGMMSLGAFFGPFLGVSLSILALQLTTAGIASTIMSIVPVLIIPFSVLLLKERVKFLEILGAVAAIGGVALQFL